jgi:Lon protease-like protein
MGDEDLYLHGFDGKTRLFPLPGFVMFPYVLKPLHIFEPRYRQMTEDALASDHLISIVLLKPHTPEEYLGNPPIHDTACLCRIINSQRLEDGRFNIVVRGLCRLRIESEIPSEKLYRLAHGWPMPDGPSPPVTDLRQTLLEYVRRWLPAGGPAIQQLETLFQQNLAFGALIDILAFALPLDPEVKQALLDEPDVPSRARKLLHALKEGAEPLPMPRERPKFPPEFSIN